MEKLSFEIESTPVQYLVGKKPFVSNSHKVLFRSDTGSELSVMKNSYTPMLNQHFMETTQRMQEISGFELTGYSEYRGGAVVLSHLKNNQQNVVIGGREIQDYLLLGSSCDGKYPFFLGTSTFIPFCQNQFSRINKMEKIKHTRSAPRKVDELLKSLEFYFLQRKLMYENFERMIQYEVDDEVKQLAIEHLLDVSREEFVEGTISTRKLNQAEQLDLAMSNEMTDCGQNLWGMFNGVTYYTTHLLTDKESIFGNVFGQKAEMNKKVYEYTSKQLELVN